MTGSTYSTADTLFMSQAISLANQAALAGEVPVGAVIVKQGVVVGSGFNQPIKSKDSSAHAEIVAIRQACQTLGNYRLPGCDMYVSLEPCIMCVGALIHARISRLIYAASEPRAGAIHSRIRLPESDFINHKILTSKIFKKIISPKKLLLLNAFKQLDGFFKSNILI